MENGVNFLCLSLCRSHQLMKRRNAFTDLCRITISLLLLALPLSAPEECAAQEIPIDKPIVTIGFPAFDGEEAFVDKSNRMLEITAAHLRATLPQYEFKFVSYINEEMKEKVAEREVDFFLMPSGIFRTLSSVGALPLANFVTRLMPDPNKGVAGTFIVRRDSKIKTIVDAKGTVAAGTGPQKFMSWQIPVGKIAEFGYDPEKFFKKEIHLGTDLTRVPRLVSEGKADIGIMRSCAIELLMPSNPELFKNLRVLDPMPADGLRCLHSTVGYPGWTFGASGNASSEAAKAITASLLSMKPHDGMKASWSVATNWDEIDKLFKLLRIGPYEHLRTLTFKGFIEKAAPYLFGLSLLLIAWILHWLRVESLVRKRTQELVEAQEKVRASQSKLSQLLRLGVVSQFSTVIAHELHQPLAAMKYLADAIVLLVKSPAANEAKITEAAKQLSRSVSKSAEIVERVRAYAKDISSKETVDLKALLNEIIDEVAPLEAVKPTLTVLAPKNLHPIQADPVALKIAFANLIKNACEAAAEVSPAETGKVKVQLSQDADKLVVCIENNGKVLPHDFVDNLGRPMTSTKTGGLGYGILIAVTILEANKSSIRFERKPDGGLIVTAKFPVMQPTTQGAL